MSRPFRKLTFFSVLLFTFSIQVSFAAGPCNLALARLAKMAGASEARWHGGQFQSALNGVVFSDPGVSAFLDRVQGLKAKREAVRKLVPASEAQSAEKLLVSFELAQFAVADIEQSKGVKAILKVPELSTNDYRDGMREITVGGFLSNFLLGLDSAKVPRERRVEILTEIFKLSFDNEREVGVLKQILDSPMVKSEFKQYDWIDLLPEVHEAFAKAQGSRP